jgi:hypothetical protein
MIHIECIEREKIDSLEKEIERLKKETFNVFAIKLKSAAERLLLQSMIKALRDDG